MKRSIVEKRGLIVDSDPCGSCGVPTFDEKAFGDTGQLLSLRLHVR